MISLHLHKKDILDLKLQINKGEFIALSGKSGSGKTTLLRILSGLEESNSKIEVDGKIWQDGLKKTPIQQREIGFVFQDYALFENMSVLKNLLYVSNDKELAQHLLSLTALTQLADRLPHTLSGGQKQRVALCRALMRRPKILLLDEALSALDPTMRKMLQDEIIKLHKEFDLTTIMVSHDPSEIYRMASRVVVLEDGKIIKEGSPKEVFLQTSGSAKFSFSGEILEIIKVDVINIAIIAIGQQIVEIVVSDAEIKNLSIGQQVNISTKAFSPILNF
ncbi:MAG: ATP-binding cassette domain-containing protein [Epsilonproteobacteria bacterium]|nr:ATP-binding cassette domain-containing protein [Campylobacterota bacterium]